MQQVEDVAKEIASYINGYKIIVNKCTVPVGTARKIKKIISEEYSSHTPSPLFDIISNPEFLCEGSAVYDFTHPDKIVISYETEKAKQIMQEIYRTLYLLDTPFVLTTFDIRESAALDIIQMLLQKGAMIQCFDPRAMEKTKEIMPELTYCQDEYETAKDTDALVILTEWDQFRNLDFNKIKLLMKRHEYGLYFQPFIFDMKNLYNPEKVKKLDFKYYGIGRS